jgi:uncharacterized membrane protein
MSARRATRKLSWMVISFLITASITYLFIANWFKAAIIAIISILLEIFELKFLETIESEKNVHISRSAQKESSYK